MLVRDRICPRGRGLYSLSCTLSKTPDGKATAARKKQGKSVKEQKEKKKCEVRRDPHAQYMHGAWRFRSKFWCTPTAWRHGMIFCCPFTPFDRSGNKTAHFPVPCIDDNEILSMLAHTGQGERPISKLAFKAARPLALEWFMK